VEQLNQYDQEGVFSYSTAELPLGKKCDDVVGVKRALAGENYFELPGYSTFWSIWPRSKHQNLNVYPSGWKRKCFRSGPVGSNRDHPKYFNLAEIANFDLSFWSI
jgi:hypothetical protein